MWKLRELRELRVWREWLCGDYASLLDTFALFLANIYVYWTRLPYSWPIYTFIGHVCLILGQYMRLLDTLTRFLANISVYWTRLPYS